MTFIPGPSPRVLAFDRLVAETADLAQGLNPADFHPDVREVVAELGRAASDVFLPNIVDGVAEVPNSLLGTSSYGLFPLLSGEDDIAYGASFGRCTPQRVQRMAEQYGPRGTSPQQIRQIVEASAAHAAPFEVALHEGGRDAVVSTLDGYITFKGEAFHISSRPLITVGEHAANVVLQMLVQAEDCERSFYPPPASEEEAARRSAIAKLRAYHVGYVAGGGLQGVEDMRMLLVERLRRISMRLGQAAFDPDEAMVQYFARRGIIP